MTNLRSFEMLRIKFTGILYALAYYTTHNSFLGVRWNSWIKWGLLIFTVAAWFGGWPRYWVAIGLVLYFIIQLFYWIVRRQGYIRFLVVGKSSNPEPDHFLTDNQKVKALATGLFSVSRHQAYVLQKEASYWRVPVGDHAIMVQHEPEKFLYQFVQAGALQRVESGFLIFGRRPQGALAITFFTSWGPEFGDTSPRQLMSGANNSAPQVERTIYLTFAKTADLYLVRKNLLRDIAHQPPSTTH